MKEYLIIQCEALNDQWECDAMRTPLCMVNDYSKYGLGYEIWERQADNSFKLIKDYEEALEKGFSLYSWDVDEETADCEPIVQYKKIGWTRNDITKAFVKKLKQEAGFHNTVNEIFNNIVSCGFHGEVIGERWVVFGKYMDNHFTCGY